MIGREIYKVEVEGKAGYFRKLTKKELIRQLDKITTMSANEMAALLLKTMWIKGDIGVITKEPYLSETINKMDNILMQHIKAAIPNLYKKIVK